MALKMKDENDLRSLGPKKSFFSKWNKDKLIAFYNSSDFKLKLYLKGHVFYNIGDPHSLDKDRFYIVKEGQVQLESQFDLEYISKVPIQRGQTQWKVRSEKRQGEVALKYPGTMFGFEETAKAAAIICSGNTVSQQFILGTLRGVPVDSRGRKATAMTDCVVMEGSLTLLFDYLMKNEVMELAEAAKEVEGQKLGHQFLNAHIEKQNQLERFLNAAQYNIQMSIKKPNMHRKVEKSVERETFKNRKTARMQEWVEAIQQRHLNLSQQQQRQATTKIVDRKDKYMITDLHYASERPASSIPYLVDSKEQNSIMQGEQPDFVRAMSINQMERSKTAKKVVID